MRWFLFPIFYSIGIMRKRKEYKAKQTRMRRQKRKNQLRNSFLYVTKRKGGKKSEMKKSRFRWEEQTEERKRSIVHNRDRNNLHTVCKSGTVRLSYTEWASTPTHKIFKAQLETQQPLRNRLQVSAACSAR